MVKSKLFGTVAMLQITPPLLSTLLRISLSRTPKPLSSQFPSFDCCLSSNQPSPMASPHASLPSLSSIRSRRSPPLSPNSVASLVLHSRFPSGGRCRKLLRRRLCRAMVQQAAQGAPAIYAKEMERLSAKESLLLAFKDSGGFEALVTGKITDMQRIDVNERITGLERLNPTPRPTTSPFLEGRWNFEWFGSGSPGLAATIIFQRFPSTLANLSKLDAFIKDGTARITANVKLLNSIESKVILSTKLSVEGPLRLKEEYVEGVLETPSVSEQAVPEQLKSVFSQVVNTVQQLPVPIKDVIAGGLRVPLTGSYQRLMMISYLDEEILITRDTSGVPEVLTRLDSPPTPLEPNATDYES